MTIIPIMIYLKRLVPILGLLVLLVPARLSCQAPEPVVHALLFFHPTCPHCHQLINEHLIPLQNQYGNRLVLLGMDTSQPWANNLYYEAIRFFEIPEENWVVPMLIVADQVLIGGDEIPRRFPAIIEEGLAGGGVDLPNYPALISFLREQDALDPRYPDRLIVRQGPSPQADAPDPHEDPVPAGDTVPGEAPAETGPPADTAEGRVGEGQPEAVPGPDEPSPVEDSVAGDPGAEDSAPGDSVDEAPRIEAPSANSRAGDPSAVDSSEEEEGRPETGGGDSSRSGPLGEASTGSVGSMDLAQAARGVESMTMWDRFNLDTTGSSISVLVLFGMIVSLVLRGFPPRVRGGEWPIWVIPALVVVGVGVASYLSFIEITHAQAACGPVGDCNTVNQSEYAYLFGVLPVGVFGLMGYGLILAFWLLRRVGPEKFKKGAGLGLWGAALFGTLFSAYLTFLEPFVIGATCAWCLSSAVIMTLLLWASAPVAARAWPGSR